MCKHVVIDNGNNIMKHKQTISLEELITNPKPLKLLILHSPFPLALDPLKQCVNLIKLDVSGNNLQTVPYLGNLVHLRFLFLHNNKLDFEILRGVFSDSSSVRSPLSNSIVWVTFWGNRNSFYARHFLVNNTAAIAVDTNVVVEEERSESMQKMVEPFSPETELEFPLVKVEAKGFSEEQYIKLFYSELTLLRIKYRKVNPVLTIQSVMRGSLVRTRIRKENQRATMEEEKIRKIVRHWINYAKNRIRLRQIAKKRKIQYLTRDLKQYKRHMIEEKMREIARAVKNRVRKRNSTNKHQIIIRNAFRRNHTSFKLLYQQTQFNKYNKVYVNSSDASIFRNIILPHVRSMHANNVIQLQSQKQILGIELPMPSVGLSPYINILYPGFKSVLIIKKSTKQASKKKIFGWVPFKPVDKVCHLDDVSRKKSNQLYSRLGRMQSYEMNLILKIEASESTLKDLCRAVVFYNKGLLQRRDRRVCIVPQIMIRQINASVTIQRLWRGYSIRKRIRAEVCILLKAARAATRIQRWFRRLPFTHRRHFMIFCKRALKKYLDNKIVIPLEVYLKIKDVVQQKRMKFIEQKAAVVYNPDYGVLNIQWPKDGYDSSTETILQCRKNGKPLFSSQQQNQLIGHTLPLFIQGEKADIYHLIHTNTKVKIIENAHKNQFLIVECPTMKDLKVRVFGILLLTYNFRHKHHQAVFSSSELQSHRHVLASRMSWVNRKIQNPNSIWMFCQNGRPYFMNRVASLGYRIVKQPVLIYLKETKNSFPFKVLDTLSFVFNGEINISNVNQPSFIVSKEQTEAKQLSNIEVSVNKPNISMNDLFEGWMLRENSIQKQELIHPISKTQFRAATSHTNSKKEKLVMKRKMSKTVKQGRKVRLGSQLRTQYKTQESAPELIRSSSRPQRMQSQSTSNQQLSQIRKSHHRQASKSSKQQQKFTNNFISLSNFVSKQSQLSHIREHRRKIYTEVAEATSFNRQRALQSRQKYKHDLMSRDKVLRQAQKEHQEEMKAYKKPVTRPVTREPRKIDPTRNKIHVVFPEQCFPLLPNLN